MSKKKLVIISLIVLVTLVAGIGYVSKQKYDSLLKATSEGLILGKTYGRMISQSSCIMGLKMKYASCSAIECELSANGYISGCMNTAEKDEFCSTVPNIKDTDRAIAWASNACSENSLGSEKCPKYMHKFVSVCTEQSESRTLSIGELFESGFKKSLKQGAE